VIGIKILSFVEQSGENRARAFMLNFIYSLGVMAVFMVLACLLAFAGMAWGQQSGDYRFIIPMTAVVFVFGLSMLDVWELSVPGFVGTGSASKAAQNDGYIGAFFKGSLATVLSTPCSGPLLGGVFALLMNKPPSIVFLSLGFIGLGMASPYLLIGVFPKLIRFLPKPGNWMNTFKHSMGFVMMLTAVYLLYTLNNQYVIATLTFLISLSVACWMIGKVTVSHSLISHLKAWGAAVTVVVITGVLSFNFLITGLEHEGWHRYSKHELAGMQRSINDMQSQGKTVMVDFTANWCGTCQTNFYFAINTEKVNEFAKKHGIERRIVDWSDTASDEAIYIEEFLEELGANSIPLLAIFPADQPGEVIILRDGLFESTVLENLRKVVPEEDLEELQVQHTASIPH
ncbi:MAG: disulfide bond formation protein DsbD, partial [Blastopirellula sp.]